MTERVGSSRRWMSNVFGRLVGLALVIVPAVAFGCDESTQPSAETGDQAGASTATIGAASEAAKTKFSEKNFDLQMKPNGSYQAGTEGTVEVVLVAKGPFKVNDKYPYKLALKDSAGVKFPKKTVRKDAVKLEKKKAVMTVPFTPESAGKKTIAGKFSFSVCTDEKCLIEKRDLSLAVNVN